MLWQGKYIVVLLKPSMKVCGVREKSEELLDREDIRLIQSECNGVTSLCKLWTQINKRIVNQGVYTWACAVWLWAAVLEIAGWTYWVGRLWGSGVCLYLLWMSDFKEDSLGRGFKTTAQQPVERHLLFKYNPQSPNHKWVTCFELCSFSFDIIGVYKFCNP